MSAAVTADPHDATPLESLCMGKAGFHERRFADKVAHRMSRTKGMRFTVFRCEACRAWHVGRNLRQSRPLTRT